MAISIVLFFFTFSGIRLTQLNILGNTFQILNSQIINTSLWLVFAYWLMRYFQYLPHTSIYMTYEEKLRNLSLSFVQRKYNDEISKREQRPNEKCEFKGAQWIVMPSGWNPFFKRKFKIFYDTQLFGNDGSYRLIPSEEMLIELSESRKTNFVTWWKSINYTIWRKPFVSEYALPPMLAMAVIAASDIYYLLDYFW